MRNFDGLHLETLREDLEEDAKKTYGSLNRTIINLESGTVKTEFALKSLNWSIEKLRLYAQAVEETLLFLVLQRLEPYFDDNRVPHENEFSDLAIFMDIIHGILKDEIDRDTDEQEFLRSLPTRRPADLEDFMHLEVEVLLVDPNKTTLRIVENELLNCGFRVTPVQTAYKALRLAVCTRPDVIIASSVQEDLGGVSLACALRAIPETKQVPVGILTSYARSHRSFVDLPEGIPLIRKGKNFSNDLTETLSNFEII